MKPSEIIRADAQQRGLDADAILKSLAILMKQKKALMIHEANSLLVLIKIGDGLAELHLFTEDSPLALAKALKKFIDQIRNSDLKAVYGQADNPEIVNMLKRLNVEVQEPDLPKYNWMALV